MSRYLEYEDEDGNLVGDQVLLASVSGWGDFCRWTDQIDGEEFHSLRGFVEYGGSDYPEDVLVELREALKQYPPVNDVLTIANNIIDFLLRPERGAGVLVTDGMSESDDDLEDSDDEIDEGYEKEIE